MDIEWIRTGLKKPGKSRKGLAMAMGRDASMICRILQGKRRLKIEDVEKIASYLEEPTPITQPDMTREPAPIATEIAAARRVEAILVKRLGIARSDDSFAVALEIVLAHRR